MVDIFESVVGRYLGIEIVEILLLVCGGEKSWDVVTNEMIRELGVWVQTCMGDVEKRGEGSRDIRLKCGNFGSAGYDVVIWCSKGVAWNVRGLVEVEEDFHELAVAC